MHCVQLPHTNSISKSCRLTIIVASPATVVTPTIQKLVSYDAFLVGAINANSGFEPNNFVVYVEFTELG